jgi:protocatechuate 3,4-dioxygenase beta subunit
MTHDDHDAHDGGLAVDIVRLIDRRRALRLLGGLGVASIAAACAKAGKPIAAASPAASAGGDCQKIPEETGGPFPGDGSNGPDILSQAGVVRSDITKSIGGASGVAEGVPLTVRLTIVSLANGCAPYTDAAVYAWHCDRSGGYSMYSPGVENENYCRGVQAADASGALEFKTIFPAAYAGRWPHIHFEVYPDLNTASTASGKLATSQLALPKDACDAVYATTGYEQSVRNMQQTSLASDMVFSDGYSAQLPRMSGNITDGYTAELTVAV